MVRFTIDRFVENYAVCADNNTLETRTLHRSELPKEAMPGDTLFHEDNRWQIDREETAARTERIRVLYESIKKRSTPE